MERSLSHMMCPRASAGFLFAFESLPVKCQNNLPLALNIKADGLAGMVKSTLAAFPELDAFVFDMAVPDMRAYFDCGIPVFTRMSEVEIQPCWLEQSSGIWLDSFGPTWFETGLVGDLLATGKRVCVVSPELHGREPKPLWEYFDFHFVCGQSAFVH